MTKKELEILLSRVEGIKSLLESNSLEQFQQEVLKVENYLKRFGSLAELLSHLEKLENTLDLHPRITDKIERINL